MNGAHNIYNALRRICESLCMSAFIFKKNGKERERQRESEITINNNKKRPQETLLGIKSQRL